MLILVLDAIFFRLNEFSIYLTIFILICVMLDLEPIANFKPSVYVVERIRK